MKDFQLFIDDDRYSVPTVQIIIVESEDRAREIAQQMMGESRHHLGVEVCEQGRRLFGLGSYSTPRGPPIRVSKASFDDEHGTQETHSGL